MVSHKTVCFNDCNHIGLFKENVFLNCMFFCKTHHFCNKRVSPNKNFNSVPFFKQEAIVCLGRRNFLVWTVIVALQISRNDTF